MVELFELLATKDMIGAKALVENRLYEHAKSKLQSVKMKTVAEMFSKDKNILKEAKATPKGNSVKDHVRVAGKFGFQHAGTEHSKFGKTERFTHPLGHSLSINHGYFDKPFYSVTDPNGKIWDHGDHPKNLKDSLAGLFQPTETSAVHVEHLTKKYGKDLLEAVKALKECGDSCGCDKKKKADKELDECGCNKGKL